MVMTKFGDDIGNCMRAESDHEHSNDGNERVDANGSDNYGGECSPLMRSMQPCPSEDYRCSSSLVHEAPTIQQAALLIFVS